MCDKVIRCGWAGTGLMRAYHDQEWGVPVHEDAKLFEFLVLEGAQAGLTWATILNRRENYREAFAGFDVQEVARFDEQRIETLLSNLGIIRNRLKIRSVVQNARKIIEIQKEFSSFDRYIWGFSGGKTIQNRIAAEEEVPKGSEEATRMSRDLRQRGFSFIGPVICYAFMQAIGMVNDHWMGCYRFKDLYS